MRAHDHEDRVKVVRGVVAIMLNDDAITPVEGDKLAIKGRSPSKHADAPNTPLSRSCELMSAESLGFSCRLYAGWWLANMLRTISRIPRLSLSPGLDTSPPQPW